MATGAELHVVTGAFGYSGRYIARRLLEAGYTVRTLTNSPDREDPFGGRVEVRPFDFDRLERLVESLRGAAVLHNTYWVRFNYPSHDRRYAPLGRRSSADSAIRSASFTHSTAVENTLILFAAAKQAGVQRVVHVGITNPSEDSPLEYFRGKARLERALVESGLSYAILRPTVLFGAEDILISNIAWLLRHFPVFGVFGDGRYRLQPVFVDDLAALAVRESQRRENVVIDAIGPETFTYRELVETIAQAIGKHRRIVGVPPGLGHAIGWAVGRIVGDVLITREEIQGLMEGLLCTNSPPAGDTKFSEWVREHAGSLGLHYASELARRRVPQRAGPACC